MTGIVAVNLSTESENTGVESLAFAEVQFWKGDVVMMAEIVSVLLF